MRATIIILTFLTWMVVGKPNPFLLQWQNVPGVIVNIKYPLIEKIKYDYEKLVAKVLRTELHSKLERFDFMDMTDVDLVIENYKASNCKFNMIEEDGIMAYVCNDWLIDVDSDITIKNVLPFTFKGRIRLKGKLKGIIIKLAFDSNKDDDSFYPVLRMLSK